MECPKCFSTNYEEFVGDEHYEGNCSDCGWFFIDDYDGNFYDTGYQDIKKEGKGE